MRVLGESWCFCNGGGKSERLKGTIFSSKSPAMARLSCSAATSALSDGGNSGAGGGGGGVVGSGFLIHRSLILTTHGNLPSASAAETAEIRLQNGALATLVPHRFFITSSVLDLTIVGIDYVEGDSTHYLKTCSKPNLDLGSAVYILGYTEKKELAVGEGKVVIATDNLIKLSTDGVTWRPGSAGFDAHGNLAFMICDPMKLASSPHAKSSSPSTSSSSSWKKDLPMQFGIPMPVICDWLNQHWEGNLDEHNKPKLPLMRLVSAGHKSDHRSASFTMRQIFKRDDTEADVTASSSSNVISKQPTHDDNPEIPANTHAQGIPTPEIYESPKVTATPMRKNTSSPIPLLDINFPPRVTKPNGPQNADRPDPEVSSTGSVNGALSEVQSSSPVCGSEVRDGQSEVETMYSAETAESRNYTSPREVKFPQPVGRSQSCVNYNRWAVHKYPVARKTSLEKQRSFTQPRKTHSQGATSHRSNDYFSPTVSSIMKKRGEPPPQQQQPTPVRVRQTVPHSSSPRWNF